MKFDPNAPGLANSGIFGLPYKEAQSHVIYIPVPWEATTSYGGGTAKGPKSILKASPQADLFDPEVIDAYENGFFMMKESADIVKWNTKAKPLAKKVMSALAKGQGTRSFKKDLNQVNALSEKVNQWVFEQTDRILSVGKVAVVVGGDHSTPLGALQAYGKHFQDFGILHFDAHLDLRDAYEGFIYSHASIMRNVCETVPQVKKLTQVGIRDFCQEEVDYTRDQSRKIQVFYDYQLQREVFSGKPWIQIAKQIVSTLPQNVYVSFDIDALDPKYCPSTGTPVPGGLELEQSLEIVRQVVYSGRRIIGMDLNEVAPGPDEWDANVGMRLLYKLTNWMLASQGKAKLRS